MTIMNKVVFSITKKAVIEQDNSKAEDNTETSVYFHQLFLNHSLVQYVKRSNCGNRGRNGN